MNKLVRDQRKNFETNDKVETLASKSRPGSASKENRAERDLIQNQPTQPP